MPDPTKQTISATESPGLFGVSPYVTRWMLWQHFANGVPFDDKPDSRMSWGSKLQPLVLEQAAEDLKLEVRPNAADAYHRRGRLGCTRDATIICPDRGPGALETKCVFDYGIWMQNWQGGKAPPRQHEIQLQQQMFVGDGEGTPVYQWGVIAAWVAGEMHYFERAPIPHLCDRLTIEAAAFFHEVATKTEPDPFGVPIELPWLTALFPLVAGNPLDLSGDASGPDVAIMAREYRDAKEQEAAGARTAEGLRAKIFAVARDHDEIILPAGIRARIRKSGKGKTIKVYVPDEAPLAANGIPEDILMAG